MISSAVLTSRFAAVRVRPVKGEAEPTKYCLSSLPAGMPLRDLVDLAKLRGRIERDYQELKQEFGLGHYEGRQALFPDEANERYQRGRHCSSALRSLLGRVRHSRFLLELRCLLLALAQAAAKAAPKPSKPH